MDTSYEEEEEAAPLFSRPGIPTAVRDTRKPYQKQLAVYIILASLLFERIAFYSIAANLVISLGSSTPLNWQFPYTLIASFIFSGTSYLSTVIFAVISDAKLGRAKTIIVGFFLYFIGYTLAILTTNPYTHKQICGIRNETSARPTTTIFGEPCADWILPTLIVIAIGAGAVQSNMAVLGAEQIQESKLTSRYFDKYMVAVNIGGIIAKLGIPSVSTSKTYYYFGYIAAASTLCLAALLFIIGWRYYIHVKTDETVVTNCIPVIINAFQTKSRLKKKAAPILKENRNSSASNFLNVSDSLTEAELSERIDEQPSTFLDFAKAVNHGKFHDRIVDDVKSLRNAFIVFGFFIPFWLVYNQIYSSFPMQGQQMDTLGDPRLATWMSLGDPVTIIIGILVLNMFVYKHIDARNRAITIVTKFVIGMIIACITMCLAGSVEIFRQIYCDDSTSQFGNSSSLIIYAQLPQNIGIGLAEIFAMVASYEYAYFAAPRSAQSLFMSLRFCSLGISSFLGAAYTTIFSPTSVKLDFRCPALHGKGWHLFTYFYILGGVQLIFIIIFILCQKKFRIIKLNPQQMETNQFLSQPSTSSTNRD